MQREEVQLLQCWTFMYGVLLLRGGMRAAVPSISAYRRINLLKICRETRERLMMMNI